MVHEWVREVGAGISVELDCGEDDNFKSYVSGLSSTVGQVGHCTTPGGVLFT